MKRLLFLLALPLFCKAQIELPKVDKDTLFTTSGFNVIVGMDLKLGAGSLPNGDFKYVAISASSWANIMDASMSKSGIGRRYSGHLVRVKKFRKDGNKKRGYVYNVIIGGGNIANYDCDIENAIASGEVVVPDEFKPKLAGSSPATPDPADQLKKLKGLYDSGALTKEEYDSAKKKVLSKM